MSDAATQTTGSIVPDWDQLGPWLKDLEEYLKDIDEPGSMEALFGLSMFLATVELGREPAERIERLIYLFGLTAHAIAGSSDACIPASLRHKAALVNQAVGDLNAPPMRVTNALVEVLAAEAELDRCGTVIEPSLSAN